MDDAPCFRTPGYVPGGKGGRPHPPKVYTKRKFEQDFARTRAAVFGQNERRQMLDIRRTGSVEAIAGEATREQLGHAMANSIGRSNALFDTYVPLNVTSIDGVAEARKRGRNKLRQKNG